VTTQREEERDRERERQRASSQHTAQGIRREKKEIKKREERKQTEGRIAMPLCLSEV